MKTSRTVLAVLLAGAFLAGGCTPERPGTSATTPAASTTTSTAAPVPVVTPVPVGPMKAETAAEKAAVALAATPKGRKWGAGNPTASAQAAGQPFLAGYYVTLIDGSTQYVVCVMGGTAVPYFGVTGPKYVKSAKDPYNSTTPAATDRQKAAAAAAKAFVADVAPNAQPSGIALYLVYFPQVGEGAAAGYPSVSIFAKPPSANQFAAGGMQFR